MKHLIPASLLCASLLSAAYPALAQEKKEPSTEKSAPQAVKPQEDDKIYNMVINLIMKKKPAEQKHFFMTYTNYNIIETVKIVQKDVGNAIDKCGENNPDMKENLDTRYKSWNDAVNPIIKDAEANLHNMMLAQDYAKKQDIEAIFKEVDDTRDRTQSEIEKIPVTTPEACKYLLEKMDETQTNMVELLKNTLLSFSQVFPEAADEEIDVDALELDKLEEKPAETKTPEKPAQAESETK
ncbi:MAG: hypothetical protein K9G62_03660 [Alphaproteobacteria bacterium]|nr:hypothetical protein [Alphaproteobacteria bacterium]